MPPRQTKALARVECIIARNAATGVIFRRGPSRFVRMLKWNLRNDKIEGGQWIEARVHVDRSDISPDGELVAAFVASYRRKPGTWTAISRPPYFTALAVWPKGDTWGGGGLFGSDTHLFLWHDTEVQYGVDQFKLLDDFTLPNACACRLSRIMRPCDIGQSRMVLSGWRFVQRYVWRHGLSAFAEPEIMARPLDNPKQPPLRAAALAHVVRNNACRGARPDDRNAARHRPRRLGRRRPQRRRALEQGRLLFRLAAPTRQGMVLDAEAKLVADLNDMTFEAIEAPRRGRRWP